MIYHLNNVRLISGSNIQPGTVAHLVPRLILQSYALRMIGESAPWIPACSLPIVDDCIISCIRSTISAQSTLIQPPSPPKRGKAITALCCLDIWMTATATKGTSAGHNIIPFFYHVCQHTLPHLLSPSGFFILSPPFTKTISTKSNSEC
jgi:hypothetical protein